MELPPLASHLMLDSPYAPSDYHQHRRHHSSSSASSSSIHSVGSYDFSSTLSDSPYAFQSPPGDLNFPQPPPHFSSHEDQSHHALSPELPSASYHLYRHSSSQSSDGSPPPLFGSDGQHSPPNMWSGPSSMSNQRPHKRLSSIRSSRNESSPYPSSHHSNDGYASDSGRSDLPDFMVNSMKIGGDTSESESDWGDSRRSSMSSTGWSSYDPSRDPSITTGSPALLFYETSYETSMPSLGFGQPGQIGLSSNDGIEGDDGRNVEETHLALERSAASVKNAPSTSAQDRCRGAYVQLWLGLSYSRHVEGNVSRQGLYGSYLKSCATHGVKAINSASFGKAVRQKFPDIKTRRLGVRGASRYHYCGIRPANSAEAAILAQIAKEDSNPDEGGEDNSPPSESHIGIKGEETEENPSARSSVVRNPQMNLHSSQDMQPLTPTTARPKNPDEAQGRPPRRHHAGRSLSISVPQAINFGEGEKTLGGAVASKSMPDVVVPPPASTLPGFPQIEEALIVAGMSLDHQQTAAFWDYFKVHCNSLLDVVRAYRFDQFELNIRTWWTGLDESQRAVVQHPLISHLLYRADAVIYAEILDFLHLQILVNMPPQAFASLRGLADHMERIQSVALSGFQGQAFPGPKVELAARFGHLITRHLGLCQLAQALTGILSTRSNLVEMSQAWEQIDFESIKNQSALVSNCQHETLETCFDGFKQLLVNPGPVPIESFIQFGDQFFTRCISPTFGGNQGQTSPRSLLVRWSFVTSQIMRDLTLRSAPTFGSFAIASTFFNEFLGFQVLRRVALQISAVAAPALVEASYMFSSPQEDVMMPYSMQQQPGSAAMDHHNPTGHLYAEQAPSFSEYDTSSRPDYSQLVSPPQSYQIQASSHHQQQYNFARGNENDPHLSEPIGYGGFDVHAFESTPAAGASSHDLGGLMDVERFGDLRFNSSSPASVASPSDAALTPASS